MLHLPEEDAEKEAKEAAELLQKAAKASEALKPRATLKFGGDFFWGPWWINTWEWLAIYFPGGIYQVVVSNIFYFHPYLGKWYSLTNISTGLKPPPSIGCETVLVN